MARSTQLRGDRAREAILQAAGGRFLADGLRATSIEAIAATAGVSRPTVYAHFASKDDVFRTVVQRLYDERFAAMETCAAAGGSFAERLYAVLAAYFLPLVRLTASSAHGAELVDENSRVCGDITQAARLRAIGLVERVLDTAELDLVAADLTPTDAAALAFDAARGLKPGAPAADDDYARRLRRLVAVLHRGLESRP